MIEIELATDGSAETEVQPANDANEHEWVKSVEARMTNDELMTKHEGGGKPLMSSEVETSR